MDKEGDEPNVSTPCEKKRKKSEEELSPQMKDKEENSENKVSVEEENGNENTIESTTNNKENWKEALCSDFRDKIVKKLIEAISAKDENCTKLNKAIGDRECYAKAIEENMLKLALCKSQYCHFIHEKLEQIKSGSIDKILKEAEKLILSKEGCSDEEVWKRLKDAAQNDHQKNGRLKSAYCPAWMEWLIHSEQCQENNLNNDPNFCNNLTCKQIINFLNHVGTCTAKQACTFPKCYILKKSFYSHWITCASIDCPNCKIIGKHSSKIFKNISGPYDESTNNESMPSTSRGGDNIPIVNDESMPSTSGLIRTVNNLMEQNSTNNQTNPPENQQWLRDPEARAKDIDRILSHATLNRRSEENIRPLPPSTMIEMLNWIGNYRPKTPFQPRSAVAESTRPISPWHYPYPRNSPQSSDLPTTAPSTTPKRVTFSNNVSLISSNNASVQPCQENLRNANRTTVSVIYPPRIQPFVTPLADNAGPCQRRENPSNERPNSIANYNRMMMQRLRENNALLRMRNQLRNVGTENNEEDGNEIENENGNEDEGENENENEHGNENENRNEDENRNQNQNEIENENNGNENNEGENNPENSDIVCITLNEN